MWYNFLIPLRINRLQMNKEWVEILFTYDEVEADIVKNVLEGENIEVMKDSMKIRPYPVSIGRLGEVRLFVKNDDEQRARDILSIMEQSKEKDAE